MQHRAQPCLTHIPYLRLPTTIQHRPDRCAKYQDNSSTQCSEGAYRAGDTAVQCSEGAYRAGDTAVQCSEGAYRAGDTAIQCSEGAYRAGDTAVTLRIGLEILLYSAVC